MDCVISDNLAMLGGGVYVTEVAPFFGAVITGGEISANTADLGGAIYGLSDVELASVTVTVIWAEPLSPASGA